MLKYRHLQTQRLIFTFNINKFLKNLKKNYQITIILASRLKIVETFSLLTNIYFPIELN
jgi:hypothetical protein